MAKQLIIVAGMHRSGTSTVARCVNVLGVPMGDHLMPANEFNEKGYWEDEELTEVNEDLLRGFSSNWHQLRPPPDNLLSLDTIARVSENALDLLKSRTDGDIFCFKDPRICLFADFWLDVADKLGLETKFIFALRNPREVAGSIKRRNGFSEQRTFILWQMYIGSFFEKTKGRPVLVVDYNQLLDNPDRSIERMSEFLDLNASGRGEAVQQYKEEFLDEGLNHNEAQEQLPLPHLIENTYEALRGVAEESVDLLKNGVRLDDISKAARDQLDILDYLATVEHHVAALKRREKFLEAEATAESERHLRMQDEIGSKLKESVESASAYSSENRILSQKYESLQRASELQEVELGKVGDKCRQLQTMNELQEAELGKIGDKCRQLQTMNELQEAELGKIGDKCRQLQTINQQQDSEIQNIGGKYQDLQKKNHMQNLEIQRLEEQRRRLESSLSLRLARSFGAKLPRISKWLAGHFR